MKKRFLILQFILVILLGVSLVGYTYSWSHRASVKTGYQITPMTLDYTAKINGNKCTATTYQGTWDEDAKEIIYSETPITSLSPTAVTEDSVLYFRTDITNASAVATNTSLFVDISYSDDLVDKYFICTSSPTVERSTYESEDLDGLGYILRWVPVVNLYEIPEGTNNSVTAYIEWYVEFEGSGNFEISKIILTNN